MTGYMIIILFSYLLVQGVEYWLKQINLRYMRRHGMKIPLGFEGFIDKSVLKKTIDYTMEKHSLSLIESLFSNAVLLVFLFGGLLDTYNSWILSLDLPFVPSGVLFFLLLTYAGTLVSIPFNLYSTFRIENRYGFNTMTLKLWLADSVKSLLISSVIIGLILSGGFWIIQKSPDYWWLSIWGFFFAFSIFMMYIAPYVIEPLFNKFTPLEGGEIEEKIRAIMKKAGIKVSRVFKIDASKRSRHTNAYFTGIGKVKRIVLYDTLIRKMNTNEILAVLAHEAGHWKKKHVLKRIIVLELLSFIGAYISFAILKTDLPGIIFNIQNPTFFSSLIILGFIFSIAAAPFTPLFSYISRRHEYEADRFARELTSDPESLATSLIKLSKDNLSTLHPHPLYAKVFYSHPPVVERVRKLRKST